MKSWDVIVIGGGIIGLSLSIELHKKGASVLVVERGEPGREASYAAGGMLVDCRLKHRAALQPLATASARMYPEFVHELHVESSINVDLRDQGAIFFPSTARASDVALKSMTQLLAPLSEFEPALTGLDRPAFYLQERSVDPRALTSAALHAAKHRAVDFSSDDAVTEGQSFRRLCQRSYHEENFIPRPEGCQLRGRMVGADRAPRFPDPPGEGADAVPGLALSRPAKACGTFTGGLSDSAQ